MATPQDRGSADQDVTGLPGDDAQELMNAEPEKYPEHLRIASSLDRWAETLKEQQASGDANDLGHRRREGLLIALPEVATALRQGQFLPGTRHRAPTGAELENAERAADAKIRSASEEGYNG